MSFSPRPLLPATLLLALAACQSTPSQPQRATAPVAAKPAASADTTGAVASTPGAAYRVFRGRLPDQTDSVTVQLVTTPARFVDLQGSTGHHGSYYGPDGHPYELRGQPSLTPDSLLLDDERSERAPRTWRLRQQPDGSLAGTLDGQAIRLRLVPTPASRLTLAVRCFADSLAAFKNPVHSPKARIFWQALVPTGDSPVLRRKLAAAILRDLRDDTTATRQPLPLPTQYNQERTTFFKDYREETAELASSADTADFGSYRASLNYTSQQASYVLFREGNLLSLAYFGYDYAGGAHGNYGTTGASYDLRTGRRLRYTDIFRPEAARQLPALLAVAVRPLIGLGASEPLDKELFVKQMPITHNVFLTTGGVEFIYQPYEIAAYAQGEVRVFLPLGRVRTLLKEDLPLPAVPTVTRR